MTGALLTVILATIVALAIVAKKLRVPYPVVFVLGGLVLALIPGVPTIQLRPDLVFLLFLPPLIFGDGWTTDYRSFMRFRRPIFWLAFGLVFFTSAAVALFAHQFMGLPLAVGFVLGGILSPTDAVATDAIAEELSLPAQLSTIISGESIVNDASGLVVYRFAVLAVMTGAFSLAAAIWQFAYAIGAGLAIGIGGAWAIGKFQTWIRSQGLSDPLIAVSVSLVTPFALYVPADALGASGVIAALSGAMFLNRRAQLFTGDERIAGASVWNLLFFVFNGAAFVLIGLELRTIVRALPMYSLATLVTWGLAVSLLLVIVRFAWCFAATYGRRRLFPKIRINEGPDPPWQAIFVLSYAGMRGIVSLAAALALPETLPGGAAFPERSLILFITFCVIVFSLVLEGLTLPWWIIRFRDHLGSDEADLRRMTAFARATTAQAAQDHLRTLEGDFTPVHWEIAGRIAAAYDTLVDQYAAHVDGLADVDTDAQLHEIERRLRREAYGAERASLSALRTTGDVNDQVYRDLERRLDLAESRL